MISQDSNISRIDRSSTNNGVGVKSFRKNQKITSNPFTPSPLKNDGYNCNYAISENLEEISNILALRNKDQFFFDHEEEYNYDNECQNSEENKKNENIKKYNLNSKKIDKDKNYYKSINNNIRSSYNLSTTSNTYSLNNNSNLNKNKEKSEEFVPLTSNLKNFLQNYDHLLGMIGSNSKSSTMTTNFSYDNGNLEDDSDINKIDEKKSNLVNISKKVKFPKISNFAEDDNSNEISKSKFSSSFKNKNIIEINHIQIRDEEKSENYFNFSNSFKNDQSDLMTQFKKSKELDNDIINLNPINPIFNEAKSYNKNKNTKRVYNESNLSYKTDDYFSSLKITPKQISDENYEKESDDEFKNRQVKNQLNLIDKSGKINLFNSKESEKENSLIILNPKSTNSSDKTQKIHRNKLILFIYKLMIIRFILYI